jgi:S1-C subfamily serine protease
MAKEFLSQKGVAVQEKDVSRDQAAAAELTRLGQRGVPVTVFDGDVVVGFDRPRLDALARRALASARPRPSLGLKVADAATRPEAGRRPGAFVGDVRPNSAAAQAGLRAGDVVTAIDGRPVRTADDLIAALTAADRATLTAERDGRTLTLEVRRG